MDNIYFKESARTKSIIRRPSSITPFRIRPEKKYDSFSKMEKEEMIDMLEREMMTAAEKLDFEHAAELRDEIDLIRGQSNKKKGFRYSRR